MATTAAATNKRTSRSKLGWLLATTVLVLSTVCAVSTVEAAACKYNNGLSCPQETPCCSPHGHCGNSPLACSSGCDASASFNGRCERFIIEDSTTSKTSTNANGKPKPVPSLPKGAFKIVGNTGVAAQHIVLISPTKMLIIDKAEANPPKLPNGLSAYNAEYDLVRNDFRVLDVRTNTFCSGGGFLANGTFISAGGAEVRHRAEFKPEDGFQSLRMWNPCEGENCGAWIENPSDREWMMTSNRWYVSITTLPSGELFVLGGSNESLAINANAFNNPTWELYPKPQAAKDYKPVFMQFMVDAIPNNLYPNVYSLPDGNIYIFANQKSMIFNVERNEVIRHLPDIPGGPRSYPLTGSHVLLPLDPAKNYAHEVLVCGGSERMAQNARALQTCGRINLADSDPQWEMDEMPSRRLMGDAVILADGKVMLLNGCQTGYAGFLHGNDPNFTPVIYDPNAPLGERFTEWVPSNIARMYHSVAMLLPDGSVFVAGSNENIEVRTKLSLHVRPYVRFPTEYRVESFTPPYLTTDLVRPEIVLTEGFFQNKVTTNEAKPVPVTYGQKIEIVVDLKDTSRYEPEVVFMLGHKGFVTHSTHMSQRMTKLVATVKDGSATAAATKITYEVDMPPNANIMPPGPHYIHMLNNGVPSHAIHLLLN